MRIGCLQFAPKVGDIDNNLNRADSVLAKANQEDLDTLDILVLPELAFTGYNFKSLQQISPFLEPSGSGISSLWARTTALKYNTNVVVGYPERVDETPLWPTGPEYYNSAIIVNGDGETVANYRKSFLYSTDEPWALEGKHGFFQGHLPGLGQTAMGICMDLNPYKFEAPWHAFEFGFHVLEIRAHLVILTMAWYTREDQRNFSRMPAEPDMETLTYWIQRLEPVIRAEDNEEVVVIFCNRTGVEGDVVYAGTSAVVGIKGGEVHVYGLLSRDSKEVLVVDTDDPPFAKLVHRPDREATRKNMHIGDARSHGAAHTKDANPKQAEPATWHSQAPSQNSPEGTSKGKPKKARTLPRIDIPEQRGRRTASTTPEAFIAESPGVPTPTAPSPTPLSARPKLVIPGTRPSGEHINTPYPRGDAVAGNRRMLGGSLSILRDTPITAYSDQENSAEKCFRLPSEPSLEILKEDSWPMPLRGPLLATYPVLPVSPVSISPVRFPSSDNRPQADDLSSKRSSSPDPERSSSHSTKPGRSRELRDTEANVPTKPSTTNNHAPMRPVSPTSRYASRSGRNERRGSEAEKPDVDAIVERLETLGLRTQSAMARGQDRTGTPTHERPQSPKSRNASRSGRPSDMDPSFMERTLNFSRGSNIIGAIGASNSVLGGDIPRTRSDILGKDHGPANGSAAHPASGTRQHSMSNSGRTSSRLEDVLTSSDTLSTHTEPVESRAILWSEITRIVGEHLGRPDSQEATRGRRRNTSVASIQTRQESTAAPPNMRSAPSQTGEASGGAIRSVRDPSRGPPVDPDDEIIAEIIFRRPGHSSHNCRSNSRGVAGMPDQTAGSTPSRRDSSLSSLDDKPDQGKKVPYPLGKDDKKTLAAEEVESKRDSTPSEPRPLMNNLGEASPSDLSSSSIYTLNSGNKSPTTPSPRAFEPHTPVAMVVGPDCGSLLSTNPEPLASIGGEPLKALISEKTVFKLERPRSAIW